MLSTMEEIVSRIARAEDLPHLDAHAMLEADSAQGILGDRWLVDHVHPSPEGHQVIANEILEVMSELQLVSPAADWRVSAGDAWKDHLSSLPDFYFLKGQRTIDSLRHWTRGEADGPPADDRFPHRMRD